MKDESRTQIFTTQLRNRRSCKLCFSLLLSLSVLSHLLSIYRNPSKNFGLLLTPFPLWFISCRILKSVISMWLGEKGHVVTEIHPSSVPNQIPQLSHFKLWNFISESSSELFHLADMLDCFPRYFSNFKVHINFNFLQEMKFTGNLLPICYCSLT